MIVGFGGGSLGGYLEWKCVTAVATLATALEEGEVRERMMYMGEQYGFKVAWCMV